MGISFLKDHNSTRNNLTKTTPQPPGTPSFEYKCDTPYGSATPYDYATPYKLCHGGDRGRVCHIFVSKFLEAGASLSGWL